jgi:hypothetical protein
VCDGMGGDLAFEQLVPCHSLVTTQSCFSFGQHVTPAASRAPRQLTLAMCRPWDVRSATQFPLAYHPSLSD